MPTPRSLTKTTPTKAGQSANEINPSAAVESRRWLILGLLSGCLALIALDNTIVNVALPRMQEDLHATSTELQWIVDSYSLLFAGTLLLAGSLGDRYGRRRALLVGLVIFGLFSLGAGLSPNPGVLMACRALMGIGGAFMMPSTLSILAQVFRNPTERSQAIGIWSAVAGGAVALGPILGGLLLSRFNWHSIFLINPILVVIAIVVTIAIVPESRDPARPKLDPLGALLSTTGLIAVVYTIIEIPSSGLGLVTVGVGVAGVASLGGFLAWELHTPAPMLDVRFFARPLLAVSVLSVAVIYFALFGTMFFVPQFLQLVRGLSPLASGIGVMPLAGGLLVASLLSPKWAARVGARTVVLTGLIAVGIGMLLGGFLTASTPYLLLGVVLGLMGTGLGLALPQATNGILASIPREKAGSGSAVNDAVGELGGSIGVAVLGGVLAASYRSSIDAAITNAGTSANTLSTSTLDAVRESLASASVVAGQVDSSVGNAIRETAGVAFTNGMTTALLVGAVMPFAGAVLVWFRFPRDGQAADKG